MRNTVAAVVLARRTPILLPMGPTGVAACGVLAAAVLAVDYPQARQAVELVVPEEGQTHTRQAVELQVELPEPPEPEAEPVIPEVPAVWEVRVAAEVALIPALALAARAETEDIPVVVVVVVVQPHPALVALAEQVVMAGLS